MDNIFFELGKHGLTGVLMAVIVVITFALLKRQLRAAEKDAEDSLQMLREQIEERKGDLRSARDELATARREFIDSLRDTNKAHTTALMRIEARWERAIESICSRLEQMDRRLTGGDT